MSGRTTRGHTFVELIILLTVMGILAISLTPSMNVDRGRLDSFAQRLRSDIHYAQEMAMTTGNAHGFRAVNATSYEIFVGAPGNPAIDPYKRTAFVINIPDFYRNVSFVNLANQPTVTFNPTGIPTIVNGPNIVFTDGAANKTIVITPNTGVAVIQ